MKILSLLALSFTLIFTGCAGSPARLAMMSSEQLQKQDDASLCAAYAVNKSAKVRAEIDRRGLLTAEEWNVVARKAVAVGMSELAMLASFGNPNPLYGAVNETVTAGGVRRQYVYRNSEFGKASYVYIEGGKVTAYQR